MSEKQKLKLELKPELISSKNLFIATPMYGGLCTAAYFLSALDLVTTATQLGLKVNHYIIYNDALISRARNNLVDTFLKSDYEYFMFIDGDIKYNHLQLMYMFQTFITNDDIEILVATYPKKKVNWERISEANKLNLIKDEKDYIKYSGSYVVNFTELSAEFYINEPTEILDGGTGFMMIKRQVFEKFKTAYPEQEFIDHDTKEKKFAFFDCKIDPSDNVYLSEDYMFTRWARRIGIKTYLLPFIELEHQGTYMYSGNFIAESELNYQRIQKEKASGGLS
jgi:hypothetical protein